MSKKTRPALRTIPADALATINGGLSGVEAAMFLAGSGYGAIVTAVILGKVKVKVE